MGGHRGCRDMLKAFLPRHLWLPGYRDARQVSSGRITHLRCRPQSMNIPKICHNELREAFRTLLASSSCYHTASVFDPLSARISADLGFEVGILGGSVASMQVLAAPDIALITLSRLPRACRCR